MSVPEGAGLALIGVLAYLWTVRRVFLRTNEAGMQVFSSFTAMLLSKLFEACVRLVSLFLILVGISIALIGAR